MEQIGKKDRNSKFQLMVRIIVSVGLIAWLVYTIQWEEALHIIREGSLFYMIAAFIAIQLTVFSSVWKWKMLVQSSVKKENKQGANIFKLGRLYYVGLFFNNFLPSSVGGDFVRVLYLGKTTGMPIAAASVAFERLTSGAAMIVIVLVASLFMESIRPFLITIYAVTALLIVIGFLFIYWLRKGEQHKGVIAHQNQGKVKEILNKGKNIIRKIGGATVDYRHENWRWLGAVAILSLLFQFGMAWINDLLFSAFGFDVPFYELLVYITLISIITMLPISINGLGVREASYLLFFKELGVPDGVAVSVSLLFFVLVAVSSLAGGLFWLMEKQKGGRQDEAIG
ncbi:flippase-like domain-containing protein [Bacillus sp. Bva_UNVM-123]|uniref:lysylphosphatidylglycerol synthase transmembrane domain-containing protein n=1 Tax=Bacillus sp. Bva_UNVM-123 TaxID=2829798 RepID=UPI00391FA67A